MRNLKWVVILVAIFFDVAAIAHQEKASTEPHLIEKEGIIRYLGNEGVLVSHDDTKIMFDPFFHNAFGQYTLVPESIRNKLFSNLAPYNDIDVIMVTHAHEDHFDANDMLRYLRQNLKVKLLAPAQAVALMKPIEGFNSVQERVTSLSLEVGQLSEPFTVHNLSVEALRIPHAGWPNRATDVEHYVYRVGAAEFPYVMHLGDATEKNQAYEAYKQQLKSRLSQVAFIPYWLELIPEGRSLIRDILNTEHTIGVHVPTRVPGALKESSAEYFSKPGETRRIRLAK